MNGSLAEIESFVNQLKSSYYQEGDDYAELAEKWYQLRLLCRQINGFADEYDYGGKNSGGHNGCRSMVKIVSKFVPKVRETLQNRIGNSSNNQNAWIQATLDVTELLIYLTEQVIRCHEARGLIKTSKQATSLLLKSFKESQPKLEKLLKSYWGYYPFFWLDIAIQLNVRGLSVLTTSLSSIPGSLLSLVSREDYVSRQFDLFYNGTLYCPVNVVNCINNPLISSLNWLSSKYNGMRTREIKVPRQNCWTIPDDGGKVSFKTGDESTDRDPVTCRVIDHPKTQPNGDVILHCQGGGFAIDFPASCDELFRDWIPKLGGATIIDICYTRLVRYPTMIQEVLDVYLWLVGNEGQVMSSLGWVPRRIVLFGDSAGALLVFSLVAVLRDIQITSSSSSSSSFSFPFSMFPKALVLADPIPSLAYPTASPSTNMAVLDGLLNPIAILNCLALYSSGIVFRSDCGNLNGEKTDYRQKSPWKVFYNTWINSEKNWLHCDPEIFEEVTNKIIDNSLTPYKSPLVSYDLELLKDLSLFLISGEFDPFLDQNLEFANSWSGKVTVDVLDDLNHGFLAFTLISKKSRLASKLCLKRLIEAFDE